MTKPMKNDSHTLATDDAWARMQQSLAREPVNPVWEVWGQQMEDEPSNSESSAAQATAAAAGVPVQLQQAGDSVHIQTKNEALRRPRMNRRRKWAITAAAAVIVGTVLATPVGNTAMAAILNQFRMQEAAVIDESDLRNIFYQVNGNGAVSEAQNRFGAFTTSSGGFSGELPIIQVQEKLGYSTLSGEMFKSVPSVYVESSQDITLRLNVDEVNQALQRLGSDELLPESVDGKPITLHMPEIVSYNLSTDSDHWANVTQMNTPVITVDPSIDVAEALKAVLNFPLLPDHLKANLQQSRVLSGEIPVPLIKGETAEELTVAGTLVIVDAHEYNSGTIYQAAWVKDGQMFEFDGGDVYQDKDEFLTRLQELITQ